MLINGHGNEGRRTLRDVLSAREIAILAAYYFDRAKQSEIARSYEVSQPRISQIIGECCQKLHDAGLPVPRRQRHGRVVLRPGDEMDRLHAKDDGQTHTWD